MNKHDLLPSVIEPPPNRMRAWLRFCSLAITLTICASACTGPEPVSIERDDSASQLPISLEGSLQNPAWSPDGKEILFTHFHGGYNKGPADLVIYNVESGEIRTLVADESDNINLPGSSWNAKTNQIVFSSSREPHDEIYVIHASGSPGQETRITFREDNAAYEPSFSPDGSWIVFESHEIDVEDSGIITSYRLDGTQAYHQLSEPGKDCRQPNWSPDGQKILYQAMIEGQWEIWVMNADGTGPRQVTEGPGDKTDASFSPDGSMIIFSADGPDLEHANLFTIPVEGGQSVQLTFYSGYDGAPSWSPDGRFIVFESSPQDPDRSNQTTLWIIETEY